MRRQFIGIYVRLEFFDFGVKVVLRDLEYIQRRALQELSAAKAASDDKSRRIHFELHSRYEEVLRAYGVEKSEAA